MPIVISLETTPAAEGSDAAAAAFQANQLDLMRGGAFMLPVGGGVSAGGQTPNEPRNGSWQTATASGSAPHVRLSPTTPTGLPTRGFTIGLPSTYTISSADGTGFTVPVSTGFVLHVWIRNPGSFSWFQLEDLTALQDTLYVLGDVNACELYFTVSVDSISTLNGVAYTSTTTLDHGVLPIEIMEIG